MTLDLASEGNFKTRSPEEANILIENFMSNDFTRNAAMSSMISDGCMDGNEIAEVKSKVKYVHKYIMVEHAEEKNMNCIDGTSPQRYHEKSQFQQSFQTSHASTQESRLESMIDERRSTEDGCKFS